EVCTVSQLRPQPPLFPYTTLFRSFGPCAFECGPSTPVIMNCARGNFSPSMPMNGIEPPSPMYIGGSPKNSWLAVSIACSSHGARSEEHTSELQSRENLVCRLLLET